MSGMAKARLSALILMGTSINVYAQTVSIPSEIEMGLLIETELSSERFDRANDGSKQDTNTDVTVSTVELGFGAELSDQVAGELAFLYEEDDTDLEVDVATVNYQMLPNLGMSVGQYYLPFGVFESHLISDPLTLELGEIRETALQVDYTYLNVSLAAYVFNGDVNKQEVTRDSDTVSVTTSEASELNNYGVSLGWSWQAKSFDVYVQADYINSIFDTDTLQGDATNGFTATGVESFEAGYNLFAQLNYADFTLIAEYTAAADGIISVTDFETIYEPSATNLEVGYQWGERTVALSYQTTEDASTLDLPEDRVAGAFSMPVADDLVFSTEVGQNSGYDESYPGGIGQDSTYFVAQLALEI